MLGNKLAELGGRPRTPRLRASGTPIIGANEENSMTARTTKPALLIVDDDPLIGESLSFVLSDEFDVRVSETRTDAMALLRDGKFSPSVALIDLGLPPVVNQPTEGFRLLADLLAWSPTLPILVLSGQNEESNARRARALGASDLIPKPCEPTHLRRLLHASLAGELGADASDDTRPLIGESPPMRKLKSQIDQYASSMFPALIEGESGSGKERVANALHQLSPRASAPFLALNCAAISASLVEPTLFGHAKGAFTGAAAAKAGYFEDAGEGTLFLDEIGELALELQPKLLRVLENGEFQRVGETAPRVSRARIVAATNRDLRAEVRAGRFRADLYHRLSVLSIQMPPLRELGEDKLRLLDHFAAMYAIRHHTRVFTLSQEARLRWADYAFPGNVRELKNIVIRLLAKFAGYEVGRNELLMEFDVSESAQTAATIVDPKDEIANSALFRLDQKLASVELAYIDAAVELAGGNMSQAARVLGISRSTLYSRLDALRPGVKSTADPE
jgi:DNA-binding NtrC family response regulator